MQFRLFVSVRNYFSKYLSSKSVQRLAVQIMVSLCLYGIINGAWLRFAVVLSKQKERGIEHWQVLFIDRKREVIIYVIRRLFYREIMAIAFLSHSNGTV